LASDKDNREKPEYFDHRKTKVRNDFIGLTERKRCECERKDDEKDSEKDNEIEHFISCEFSEGVFGNVPHRNC